MTAASPPTPGRQTTDASPVADHEPATDPDQQADPPSWVDRLEWCAVAVVVAAMTIAMVRSVRAGWTPISDEALIELRVRDVPGHLPLVGVYSRFGWNHPGPTQFYLLAIAYRLGRSSSSALLVGTVALHTAFIGIAWFVARRLDRVAGVAVLAALTAVLATTAGPFVRTPWNPYVALVSGGMLVVLAWATAERRASASAALLGVATLLVQSHLVTAPMVAMTVLTGLALAFLPRRAAEVDAPLPWRWLGVGAAIALVLWLPPLVQQLTTHPGNLTLMLEHGGGSSKAAGLPAAGGVISHAFALWPGVVRPSVVGSVLVDTSTTLPVWLLLPVAALVQALRRGDTRYVRGLVVVFASLVGLLAMVSAMTGGVFNYLLVSMRPVVAVAVAISIAGLLAAAPSQVRVGARCAGCIAVLVLAGSLAVKQGRADNPLASSAPTVAQLVHAVETEAGAHSISVSSAADFRSSELAAAVLLQLERDGHRVTSGDGDASKVGRHRTKARTDYAVIVAPTGMATYLTERGWSILAVQRVDDGAPTRVLVAARPQT